jgi:hypothetical protein
MSDNEHYVNRDQWGRPLFFFGSFSAPASPSSQRLGVGCVNFFLALVDRNLAA